MNQVTIVKIGGNVIDDTAALGSFLRAFAQIEGNKILVHGGGKIATEMGKLLGITAQYAEGRRITDLETLTLVTMVYGGLINKNIVAELQAADCNAIGLSGCDGNVIRAVKRPVGSIDYGYVGDVLESGVDTRLLAVLLSGGLVPVLAPLTHDGQGNMLNTNADTIAQETAKALSGAADVQLIYCMEKAGVLRDASDETSVIPEINELMFGGLVADNTVTAGMIPKLQNAFTALRSGVKKVTIGRAEDLPFLINGERGTHLV
jgi:acetylglutamate kinase